MSTVAIVPVAQMTAANTALEEAGFGPRNFTVAAYGATGITHAALHAWEDAAFRAALEEIHEVTILEPDEGEELPTDPIAITQSLIESQGAQWGANAPPLVGNVTAGTLYRHTDDSLWSVIQNYNADTYPDPEAIPALVRRARRPGVAEPWTQPLDSLDAYKLVNPFTGKGDLCTYAGKTWRVSQADGAGNNVWTPGQFGWIQVQ